MKSESEILKRSESGFGVRNFGDSESEILESRESDILPPTPQPCSTRVTINDSRLESESFLQNLQTSD